MAISSLFAAWSAAHAECRQLYAELPLAMGEARMNLDAQVAGLQIAMVDIEERMRRSPAGSLGCIMRKLSVALARECERGDPDGLDLGWGMVASALADLKASIPSPA